MIRICDLYGQINDELKKLFDGVIYPWQILPLIKNYISDIVKSEHGKYKLYSGNVLVGNNTVIEKNATIIGPCIIGDNTVIRTGAYIRENVIIGNNCVIGNSTELKNCILMDNVQAPHYNYIGDSIFGKNVHLGAGVICSNLKYNKQPVCIGEQKVDTTMRKVGAFLGDGVDIGCSCVLNPGTIIGKNTVAYPLLSLRGVYPESKIIKSNNNIVERRN